MWTGPLHIEHAREKNSTGSSENWNNTGRSKTFFKMVSVLNTWSLMFHLISEIVKHHNVTREMSSMSEHISLVALRCPEQFGCLTVRAYLNTQKYGLFCSLTTYRTDRIDSEWLRFRRGRDSECECDHFVPLVLSRGDVSEWMPKPPQSLLYTCQLFLRYKREIFILGVLGFFKTTRSFPKIPEVFRRGPKFAEGEVIEKTLIHKDRR